MILPQLIIELMFISERVIIMFSISMIRNLIEIWIVITQAHFDVIKIMS